MGPSGRKFDQLRQALERTVGYFTSFFFFLAGYDDVDSPLGATTIYYLATGLKVRGPSKHGLKSPSAKIKIKPASFSIDASGI